MINTDELIETMHMHVDLPDDCGDCKYLSVIDDMYATGDSPTGYECNTDGYQCPKVRDVLNKAIGELI